MNTDIANIDLLELLRQHLQPQTHLIKSTRIDVYSDGSVVTTDLPTIPSDQMPNSRYGNACYFGNTYYVSMSAAERATGVKRYWINQNCNKNARGWRWA